MLPTTTVMSACRVHCVFRRAGVSDAEVPRTVRVCNLGLRGCRLMCRLQPQGPAFLHVLLALRTPACRYRLPPPLGQAEITLDAGGQALLLSGRCLHVRLPLLQPVPAAKGAGQGGKGPGGRGGGGGGGVGQSSSGAAGGAGAAGGGVVGMLSLSMLLQPADAEAGAERRMGRQHV